MINKYKIDTDIYSIDAINESIEDFNDIAVIEYNNGYIQFESEDESEGEILFGEFMNYVIWIINQ